MCSTISSMSQRIFILQCSLYSVFCTVYSVFCTSGLYIHLLFGIHCLIFYICAYIHLYLEMYGTDYSNYALYSRRIYTVCTQHSLCKHGGINMTGEKDCSARFATGAIWEIPVAPATEAGAYRRGPLYVVYFPTYLHTVPLQFGVCTLSQYTDRQISLNCKTNLTWVLGFQILFWKLG